MYLNVKIKSSHCEEWSQSVHTYLQITVDIVQYTLNKQ